VYVTLEKNRPSPPHRGASAADLPIRPEDRFARVNEFTTPAPDAAYTDQAERGRGPGVGDGIGDAVSTELTGDGSVGAADVTRLRQHLEGIGAPLSGAPLTRCSAIGGPNECTVRTLSVLRRALAAYGPGVAQVCDAAVP
jgi:hypothetical protein